MTQTKALQEQQVKNDYDWIRCLPTTLSREYVQGILTESPGCSGFHESLLRSYAVLMKVKELLHLGTDQKLILELIALMETKP